MSARAAGHETVIAATGEEGLRRFQSEHFDLIAAKFSLPTMNGEELACWVKAIDPLQRFLLVTNARDAAPDRSSANVVLRKPFTLQEAIGIAQQLLDSPA